MKTAGKLILLLLLIALIASGLYYAFVYLKNDKMQNYHRGIFSENAYKADLSLINTEDDFTLQLSSGNIKLFHIVNINLNLETKNLRLLTKYITGESVTNTGDFALWDNLLEEEKTRIIDIYGTKENFFDQEQYFSFSLVNETEFNTNTDYSALNLVVVPNASFYQSNFFANIKEQSVANNLICVVDEAVKITIKDADIFSHSCLLQNNEVVSDQAQTVLLNTAESTNQEEAVIK